MDVINDNEQLILRAPEGKHTRKKLQLWHAASTEDSRRYALVIIHNDQHNLINIIPILMLKVNVILSGKLFPPPPSRQMQSYFLSLRTARYRCLLCPRPPYNRFLKTILSPGTYFEHQSQTCDWPLGKGKSKSTASRSIVTTEK